MVLMSLRHAAVRLRTASLGDIQDPGMPRCVLIRQIKQDRDHIILDPVKIIAT